MNEENKQAETNQAATQNNQEQKQPEPRTYTDAEVDAIVAKKHAAWEKEQQKKVKDAEARAKMSAEEKANADKQDALDEVNKLKAEINRRDLTDFARKELSGKSVSVPDGLIANLLGDDQAGTKANVESFVKLFQEAVQAQVQAKLKMDLPTGSIGAVTLTKEQILAVKDGQERRRLMQENLHLFN